MGLLDDIQAKIYELSREERTRLREWFDEFDGDSWDKDHEANVKAKKLDGAASEAKQQFTDGRYKEL